MKIESFATMPGPMRLIAGIFCIISLTTLCNAIAFPGPAKTPVAEIPQNSRSLEFLDEVEPTPMPYPVRYPHLRPRLAVETYAAEAPDQTCGYVSGKMSESRVCPTSSTCVVLYSTFSSLTRARPSTSGYVGCCDDFNTCVFTSACIDSSQYFSGTECGEACKTDIETIKCTESARPYCYQLWYGDLQAVFYECSSASYAIGDELGLIQTTYNGETVGRSWTSIVIAATAAPSLEEALSSTFDTTVTESIANSNSTDSGSATFSTGKSSTSGVVVMSQMPINNRAKSTSTGSVIAGVLGGLALVIGGGLGATWIVLRERRKARRRSEAPPLLPPPPSSLSPWLHELPSAHRSSRNASGMPSPTFKFFRPQSVG